MMNFFYIKIQIEFFILRREGVADSALWAELGIKLDDAGEKVKVAQDKLN